MPRSAANTVRRRATLAGATLLLAAARAAPASASAVDLYYERAVMSAADDRCRLFTPQLAAALASAEAQARSAAMRSGVTPTVLDQVDDRAHGAVLRTPCNGPDISSAALRVRASFAGYSRLQRMNFPGDVAAWTADRATSRTHARWLLSQTTMLGSGQLTFGLAGQAAFQGLVATADLANGPAPYAARLVMRDPSRAPTALIPPPAADRTATMARRLPPRWGTMSILAEARDPADPALLPGGTGNGIAFRFPNRAADLIGALDPRESVAVELVFADGSGEDQVRTAYVEVGDFAAGRAFLGAANR